jgi:hypothetical protein
MNARRPAEVREKVLGPYVQQAGLKMHTAEQSSTDSSNARVSQCVVGMSRCRCRRTSGSCKDMSRRINRRQSRTSGRRRPRGRTNRRCGVRLWLDATPLAACDLVTRRHPLAFLTACHGLRFSRNGEVATSHDCLRSLVSSFVQSSRQID